MCWVRLLHWQRARTLVRDPRVPRRGVFVVHRPGQRCPADADHYRRDRESLRRRPSASPQIAAPELISGGCGGGAGVGLQPQGLRRASGVCASGWCRRKAGRTRCGRSGAAGCDRPEPGGLLGGRRRRRSVSRTPNNLAAIRLPRVLGFRGHSTVMATGLVGGTDDNLVHRDTAGVADDTGDASAMSSACSASTSLKAAVRPLPANSPWQTSNAGGCPK